MNVHVSESWEPFIRSQVQSGRYRSEGEVLDEALSLLKQREQHRQTPALGMGLIGALRDDAELLDQAVEHAMKVREERPWRLSPGK
jgi:putative addiction module CopG family antidote